MNNKKDPSQLFKSTVGKQLMEGVKRINKNIKSGICSYQEFCVLLRINPKHKSSKEFYKNSAFISLLEHSLQKKGGENK